MDKQQDFSFKENKTDRKFKDIIIGAIIGAVLIALIFVIAIPQTNSSVVSNVFLAYTIYALTILVVLGIVYISIRKKQYFLLLGLILSPLLALILVGACFVAVMGSAG